MVGNYGNINTDFKFELEYLLVASSLQTIISVIISLLLYSIPKMVVSQSLYMRMRPSPERLLLGS